VNLAFIEAPHGPAWRFFLLAFVVVVAPPLFERLRLPGMVGLLIGGMLIGPNVLGWIPSSDTDIADLGQVGLLFLMFMAGVELDLNQFAKNRRSAILFGVVTFAVPLALGLAAGVWLGYSTAAAVLLGSLFASHTLVTYPVVRRMGLGRNTAVSTAVAATVLTDVLALLVLAVVAGSEGGEASGAALAFGLILGFAVLLSFSFILLPRVVRAAFKGIAHERTGRFMVSLAALLCAGALAEMFEIEAIVGAFFAGLALNRLVPNAGALMERLEFVGSALLIPTFLVSVGLLVNPSVLAQPATLALAGVFTVACLGGKALAAVASMPFLRMTRDEAGVVFALTSPQAAATLAAAFVGFEIGLFGERVVNAILVLVMVSLVAAPLAAARFGPRIQSAGSDDRPLGRSVLLPLSALDRVSGLAWLAGRISHRDSGVVVPVMVVHPSDRDSAEIASTVEQADHIVAQAGLDSEVTVRLDQDEITGLRFAAAAESASLILAEWRPGSPEALRPLVEGSSENSTPLALVALDHHPVERVVVWVTRRDHAGRRPEGPTSLAIDIAGRLGERIPVVIAAPTERIGGHVATELDGATVVTASSMSAWLGTEAKPGDLVIISLRTPWERGLRDATALAAERGVSVMLTAVPVEPGAQLAHGMRATAGV
jgi:Kef-type K+ transport system membrane component KefB